ncbi:MAG: ABC transporter substrate-binding protein [Dehalococcoidales bacterium]|nr:ABC transporter substrate-binding protein [Dehalococcoidales bacterium]
MKRFVLLILMLILVASTFTGCGTGEGNGTDTTRTITDSAGRTVEIPAAVERIVPLGNAPRMITYLGLANKVVGYGGSDPAKVTPVTAYAYANREIWANIPIVGTDSAGATAYYAEEIIAVNPDVIICSYTKELADEIQIKTGTPVVVVAQGTLFGEDYEQALRLIGDVCGVEDRAEEVIAFINDCLTDLETRASAIPDEDKPTVLGAAATFKGAHGIDGVYCKSAVLGAILANDVTEGLSDKASGVLIDKEKIIEWNPQYIFFDSGGVGLVRADYEKIPDFYAQLAAVQNGDLYQYPSSTSYYSNVEIPLVNAYYVASLLYPEQFADIDFEEKANEIFKFFLGIDNYLDSLEAVGAGYGKVTLG